MVIRKKSKEELKDQIEWFLEYEEKNWEITEGKKKEILEVLKWENLDVQKVDEIKSKLSSTLSDDEFDWLYWRFLEFPKKSTNEVKNFLLKLGIFPKWYEFLVNYVVKFLGHYVTVEPLKQEWIQEESEDFKTKINNFIEFFENDLLIPKNKLWKYFEEVDVWDFDKVKSKNNLEILNSLWISNKEDVIKFIDVILYSRTEKLKENVGVLKSIWISKTEDFLELRKVISSSANAGKIKENVEALKSIWITSVNDFWKLRDIICWWNSKKIKENIEALRSVWITSVSDFWKLSDIICWWDAYIWDILLWISSVNDYEKINGLFTSVYGNESEAKKINENLHALIDNKIISNQELVDNIVELEWIFRWWEVENIETLAWICTWNVENLKKLSRVIKSNHIDTIKVFVNEIWITDIDDILRLYNENLFAWSPVIIRALYKAWIKSVDEFIVLEEHIKHDWSYNEARAAVNIEIFYDVWIRKPEDFIILSDLIRSYSTRIDVIKAFHEAGVDWAEDFLILSDFIRDDSTRVDMIKAFHEVGVNWAEDFCELNAIIRDSDVNVWMISLFSKAWCKSAKEFKSLDAANLLRRAKMENIEWLSKVWIKSWYDFIKLSNLCTNLDTCLMLDQLKYARITHDELSYENLLEILEVIELGNNRFSLLRFLDKLKNKLPVNIYDNLCGLREIYNELSSKCWDVGNRDIKVLLLNYKWFSSKEIRKLMDYSFFYAKPENLKIIFEKYPNITTDELILLQNE